MVGWFKTDSKWDLDGEGEEVDLLEGLDLAVLDEAAQLGHRDPLLQAGG